MSESEVPQKKRSKSGGDRSFEYRKNNPDMSKLSNEKKRLSEMQRKSDDPSYEEAFRKKERDRKAAQRKRKKDEKKRK